jgi:hypothetical protein
MIYLIIIMYFIFPHASNKITVYLFFKFCNCERNVRITRSKSKNEFSNFNMSRERRLYNRSRMSEWFLFQFNVYSVGPDNILEWICEA